MIPRRHGSKGCRSWDSHGCTRYGREGMVMKLRVLISVSEALWSGSWDMGMGCYGVGLPLQVGLEVQKHHAIMYDCSAFILAWDVTAAKEDCGLLHS